MTHSDRAPQGVEPLIEPPGDQELADLEHQRSTAPTSANGHWKIWTSTGSANAFHHYRPDRVDHEMWVRNLVRPAIILGSTQPDAILAPDLSSNPTFANYEICRRRSGGGLVTLRPDQDVWLDILIPDHSTLWDNDVGRSFGWLGHLWAAVLADLFPTADVAVGGRSGPATPSRSAPVLCYGAIGHGEVSVDGRKIVGLSQRRTRNWIRLQCSVIQQWPATRLTEALAPGLDTDPDAVAAGLPPHLGPAPPQDVIEAFRTRLLAVEIANLQGG